MRIYIQPSGHQMVNMGDLAMLQAAVNRLRALWPDAEIYAHTAAPDRMRIYCPTVRPVSNTTWFDLAYRKSTIFHKALYKISPRVYSWVSRSFSLSALLARWRSRHPLWAVRLLRILKASRCAPPEWDIFEEAFVCADVMVVSGQGGLTDAFAKDDLIIFSLIELAHQLKKPIAIFGQGLGPARQMELLARAKEVLPLSNILALREKRSGFPLLEALGVSGPEIIVTGDDAVEMAYQERADVLGTAIGVNLRVASYASTNQSFVSPLRDVLKDAAEHYQAALLSVPIDTGQYDTSDVEMLKQILGQNPAADEVLDSPFKVIRQIGRCRIVVAGSYHAGVFALSQGVSVVALAHAPYYIDKFLGLAEQFGCGCEVVLMYGDDFQPRLKWAIQHTFENAERVRPQLLEAAQKQIGLGQYAYRQLFDLLQSRGKS